jgi:type IV pilus assembly protein PilM
MAAGTLTCLNCQRTNPASRRFCGGCGKSLWEKCPQCGVEAAADERFCGACGADIASGLNEQHRECHAKLQEARESAAAHRYDAAISTLRSVAAVSDARLEQWATKALAEIAGVEATKRKALADAASGLARARKHLEAYEYETAQSAIEGVPDQLLTPDHTAVLERANACRRELLTLAGEVRDAVQHKHYSELLPKLERLLALKPDHEQARSLAGQLRDKLIKSARSWLEQQKYREALDSLEQIPPFVRTDEVEKLFETAGELNGLLVELRGAALANQQLVSLADRLYKLVPGNAEGEKLRAQIAAKAKTAPAEPRLGAPNWAEAPARTPLGMPVDWLAHILRPEFATDDVSSTLREHPGQFFTALGLALQGVEQTAIAADLTPQAKGGVLGMLPGLSFGRRPANVAWGLDLSDYALKAIKLSRPGKGHDVKIEACEYILHGRPLASSDVEMRRAQIVEQTLRDFLSRAGDLKGVKLAIGMPGHRVLGRFFELPPMPAKKVGASIQYETKRQLPIDSAELCWSHTFLDEASGKGADDLPRRVMVQAARQAHVVALLAQLKAAGLTADYVQSDAVALHNAIHYELFAGAASAADQAVAVLDLGTESSNIVISSPRAVWFRTFSQGGAGFTRELIKQFNLTHEQAEQLKLEPAKAHRFSKFQEATSPLLIKLTSEVERSLATYARAYADHPVGRLYGVGGAFQMHGVLRYLRSGK